MTLGPRSLSSVEQAAVHWFLAKGEGEEEEGTEEEEEGGESGTGLSCSS